ncbi:MAG: EAL domain-containing protein [Synergistaceae bacterium]|nr:EAL domain-containing protein [Synergistaceae bacterium]
MSLGRRVFLYVFVTILLMLSLASLSSNYITVRAFEDVERRFFEQVMGRVQNRLREELRVIGNYASDWGAWDSMYLFMEHKDSSLFPDMVDPVTLRALGLDFLVLMASDMKPLAAFAVGETGESYLLGPEALRVVKEVAPELMAEAANGPFTELSSVNESVYLVGVAPVVMTNRTGKPRGFVMTGVSLTRNANRLSSLLGTEFSIVPKKNGPVMGDTVEVEEDGPDMATVRQAWKHTLPSEDPLVIEIPQQRPINVIGRKAASHSYAWVFISGAGILGVVMVLLNYLIIRRLAILRSVSDMIVSEGEVGLRMPVSGNDEITTLSSSFNSLLDTLENLISDIPDAMFIINKDGRLVIANDEGKRVLGIADDTGLRGIELGSFLKHGSVGKGRVMDIGVGLQFASSDVFEAELALPDGTVIPTEVRRRDIIYGKRSFQLFLARDITERKNYEQRLARKAYFDDLTGLPNRAAFIEGLRKLSKDKAWEDGSVSVAVMNLDKFKQINELVGTVNADRILLIIATRVGSLLNMESRLYRTGGDEFSVIARFPEKEARARTEALMERIHRAVGEPCPVGDDTIFPSTSIGAVVGPSGKWKPSDVINRAQSALKKAKRTGIGFTSYLYGDENDDEAQGMETINVLKMSAEMTTGIERGEFVPYFQAVMPVSGGPVLGFETLARWKHPVRGLLSPEDFVPLAEHTGFIDRIDLEMIENALKASAEAKRINASSDIFFSANSSPLFFKAFFPEEIVEAFIRRTGAEPSLFTLEVTESLLIENMEEVSKKLFRFKELGIKIALDDFGTGYSSLQYLVRLPFDYIKLDRTFIERLFQSDDYERLLRAIINMAGEMQLEIIAEGVETQEQLEWLKAAGCTKIQGFLFSRPGPWEEALGLIRGDLG